MALDSYCWILNPDALKYAPANLYESIYWKILRRFLHKQHIRPGPAALSQANSKPSNNNQQTVLDSALGLPKHNP